MSREWILSQMSSSKPVGGGLICYDENYNYYSMGVAGYWLMYRQKRYKPDGRRGYLLTEQLAKCLGFENLIHLRYFMPSIQYWRRFVSVERLKVAFAKYDNKWNDILKDIG